MKHRMRKDPFFQYRQELKGVFVATKSPKSTIVLVKALDYRTLWEKIKAKKLDEEKISIKYLEPKGAICAY